MVNRRTKYLRYLKFHKTFFDKFLSKFYSETVPKRLFEDKTVSRDLIVSLLIIGGIETNPGPVNTLEIITINCNGLTSDIRLLQAIGRIKKKLKATPAIIFMQETHNANIVLLESVIRQLVAAYLLS